MKTNRKQTVRAYDRSLIAVTIAPEAVLKAVIEKTADETPQYYRNNPGMLAALLVLGYTNPKAEEARRQYEGKDEGNRVQQAHEYMHHVGIGQSRVGRAWGLIINCALAAVAVPNCLDNRQQEIFGNGKNVKPLIDTQGHVDFLQTAVEMHFNLDDTGRNVRSAAELFRDQIGNFATPDSNWFVAVLAQAMRGEITPAIFTQTIVALRRENAKVNELPPATIEAVTQFTSDETRHRAHDRAHDHARS